MSLDQSAENLKSWRPELEPQVETGSHFVPIGAPHLSSVEQDLVLDTLKASMISGNSAIVAQFENEFAALCCSDHATACNSGGMALILMLRALGIGPGDEVIVPSFTMIATSAAISLVGATPVFADCDERTLNLCPASVSRCVSPRTRAIICVHLYGHPCDLDALRDSAGAIPILEDAAEAHCAMWRGTPCGSLGVAAAFGFYANKVIACGEGGMVTTSSEDLARRVRSLRHYCIDPQTHFWHDDIGFSARLSALAAALGLAQTRRARELSAVRSKAASHYSELFADSSLLSADKTLSLPPDSRHGWWHYWIRVGNRAGLRQELAKHGIETRPGFAPLHLQPCYVRGTYESRADPAGLLAAERVGRSVLLLPTHVGAGDPVRTRIAEICCATGRPEAQVEI